MQKNHVSILMPVQETSACLSLWMQERTHGFLKGHWEIPGGKIEPREGHLLAAKREFLEEVGVEVNEEDINFFGYFKYEYEGLFCVFYIHYFYVDKYFKDLTRLTKVDYNWDADLSQDNDFKLPEANKLFLKQFIDFRKKQLAL